MMKTLNTGQLILLIVQSEYAFEQIHKASASLACTALDLIEREDLLQEIKQEFYNKK